MTNNIKLIKKLKQELDIRGELFYKQIEDDDYLVMYFESAHYITKATIRLDVIGAAIVSNDFSIVRDTAHVTHFDMEEM